MECKSCLIRVNNPAWETNALQKHVPYNALSKLVVTLTTNSRHLEPTEIDALMY